LNSPTTLFVSSYVRRGHWMEVKSSGDAAQATPLASFSPVHFDIKRAGNRDQGGSRCWVCSQGRPCKGEGRRASLWPFWGQATDRVSFFTVVGFLHPSRFDELPQIREPSATGVWVGHCYRRFSRELQFNANFVFVLDNTVQLLTKRVFRRGGTRKRLTPLAGCRAIVDSPDRQLSLLLSGKAAWGSPKRSPRSSPGVFRSAGSRMRIEVSRAG
jgi:hypothetical protein